MKSFLVLFLTLSLNLTYFSQNLVDITGGGSYTFTNTTNVISTNFGGTGEGIGWSANLYSDAEMGPSNVLLSLRWMIDYAATTAGDSYTMTDVSIWLYENGANTVFPSTAIPDLAANGAVNVFQGDLVFTPPAQSVPNHCEADVQFSTPFVYTNGNSLVVYVEKLTPYSGGPVSPYYGYMPGASGLRVLSNWSGTIATPLLPNANNAQQDRYALIKFNETDPADLCTQSPCDPGVTSGSTTLCPGDNEATVSVSNPNNGSVQWQQFVNGVWEDISGANSNSLTLNNVTTTTQFQAIISSSSCATATSDIATITVSPVVLPPEIESLNQPVCPENSGSISFINLPTPGVWTIIAEPIATYTGSGSTGLFENLSPGSYTFAIDWNGCTSEFSTASAVIETPQTPTPIATSNDLTACISDFLIVDDLPVSFTGSSSIALESTPVFLPVTGTDLLVNGNYFISQTDNINGCDPSDTIVIAVTIQESQIPEINNNNFTICDSEALTVADLGVTGNGGVLNYYYSDGTTIISTNTTDILQTGTYFVTQTGPNNSCESTDSLEITVAIGSTPPPTASNENQSFCVADNSTVSDLSINLSPYTLNYYYDNGTSIVSVALSDILLGGNYYITATDPNTNCTSNDSLLIIVSINDTPSPSTNTPNPLFCVTDGATIEDLVVTGENILWYDSNGNMLSQTNILSDNTSYFATQTTLANGCESSSNLEIQVTIVDPPAPLSNNLTQVFCETENPTIADIIVTGTDVQWYDTELNGTPLPTNTALIDQQSYYASQIIEGCESSEYLTVTINIQNTIDGGFFASATEGCSPLNAQLTPNFINTNATYSWYIDGEFAANTTILEYSFTESGCYDIQLLIDELNSCATDVTSSDFVCVSPSPVASFYTSPNTLAINNQLVSFQNTSSNADSFVWDFGNGSTSTQINPETNINIISETLTITLTAFSGNDCESTASITFEMPESDLYVPNSFTPDADEHNQSWGPVFLSGFDKFNFQVLVFNRWGETVWESKDADGRWDGKYSNKQLTCPEGIYTWKITYKKKNSDDRIVRTGHITLIR